MGALRNAGTGILEGPLLLTAGLTDDFPRPIWSLAGGKAQGGAVSETGGGRAPGTEVSNWGGKALLTPTCHRNAAAGAVVVDAAAAAAPRGAIKWLGLETPLDAATGVPSSMGQLLDSSSLGGGDGVGGAVGWCQSCWAGAQGADGPNPDQAG